MDRQRGLYHGVAAYAIWGLVPAYWHVLRAVDAVELIAHRAIWGCLAFLAFLPIVGQCRALGRTLRDLRIVGLLAISSSLIAVNWLTFVWATNHGELLDASLGYFLTPLVSMALGVAVLGERLRRLQWIACAFAAVGVVLIASESRHLPWISFVLAGTFGTYGLVRKLVKVEVVVGCTIEAMLMLPAAAVYFAWHGAGAIAEADTGGVLLIASSGLVTAVPLVLFTSATRLLPLSTVGFLQYLAPTGQFLLAVAAYGETVSIPIILAFSLIWIGLGIFSVDLWRATVRPQPAASGTPAHVGAGDR